MRLFLISALVFVIIFTIYRVCIENEKIIIMWIYLILASCLFIAIFILNRGVSSTQITADMLPDDGRRQKLLILTLTSDAAAFILPIIPHSAYIRFHLRNLAFYLDKILGFRDYS